MFPIAHGQTLEYGNFCYIMFYLEYMQTVGTNQIECDFWRVLAINERRASNDDWQSWRLMKVQVTRHTRDVLLLVIPIIFLFLSIFRVGTYSTVSVSQNIILDN